MTLFFLASAALLAAEPQSMTLEEALAHCSKIADTTDRLACFEGLADAVAPGDDREEATPREETPSDANSQAAPPAPVEAPRDEDQSAPEAAEPATRDRFIILRENEFEAEKRKEREKPAARQAYDAQVLKSWRYSATNQLYVALANGEIWKQSDTRRGRTLKQGQRVTLEPSFGGSWLMTFSDGRPAMRMQKVE